MHPFQFNNQLRLKNPLLMAPMTTDSATKTGGLSEEDCHFILTRASEFGAVIIGSHSVSPDGNGFERGWNTYDSRNHLALKRLTDQLHQQDVKVFLQLYHAGRLAQPAFINNQQPIAPSRIPALRSFASFPRKMTEADIQTVIKAFKDATQLASDLGMDGVEIHGANTYLIQQFYSPHSNRRKDHWGENRFDFPQAVVEACLSAKPTDRPFVVGYRFSPEEYENPGIRLDDTASLLEQLSQLPIDYLHISVSDVKKKSQDGRLIIPYLQQFVPDHLPFIACGNIASQQDVLDVLATAPLLSVGHAVLVDHLWATKIKMGSDNMRVFNPYPSTIPKRLYRELQASPSRYFNYERGG